MKSKLLFHRQETAHSCVPACLRMVFLAMGTNVSEAELRSQCDCTIFGTDALNAVDAARSLGFAGSRKATLSIDELIDTQQSTAYPIVFLNLLPIDGIKVAHAMVLAAASQTEVQLLDPAKGDRRLARSTFDPAWAMMRNLVILVQR
jgi:ABC-type bacteriocin/lantibiotic exporter with double-glycine peptidase domain